LLLFIFHYTTVATFEVSTLPVVKLARQFGPYLQNIKEQKEGEKKEGKSLSVLSVPLFYLNTVLDCFKQAQGTTQK